LGLFISKKLVEALNGMIKIDSTYGKGTQFTLFFRDIEIVKDDYKAQEEKMNFKFFGDTILIGDDLPTNLALIEAYLSNYNLKILNAENSEALIKKALTFKPSLIVTDYNMPKGDGQTIYGKLKEREETKNIPIVILTALNLDESIKEKFQTVLSKPVGKQQFIEEISKFLKHEKQVQDLNEMKSEEENLFFLPDDLEKKDLEILEKMQTIFEQSLELQNITNLESSLGELKKELKTSKLKEIDPWLDQLLIESASFQLDRLNNHLKIGLQKINTFLASKKNPS
jgi:CheY-like chemotaxis protein